MYNPSNTRKLWVLQGKTSQLFDQLIPIFEQNAGDWVTVTHQPDCLACSLIANVLKPNQTKQLLGQQYRHAVFDATAGFNLDAFAMLVGTLIKGSVLILLLPNNLATWHDQDSLRWNECQTAITVPNFIAHLTQTLAEFGIIINQTSLPKTAISPMFFEQVTDDNYDLTQQQTTLKQLLNSNKQINVVVAKRGRGKSALAGLFSHYQRCIVTAPNKSALTTFFTFAKPDTLFFAPDELIAQSHYSFANYLIIDEAAMIPLSMLEKLLEVAIANNSRVLLTTTVEGYEGTGQGFLLKLLANKACQYFYLHTPIRWQVGDELEQFSDRLLLNGVLAQDDNPSSASALSAQYAKVDRNDIHALRSIFYLLKIAHYQTTLIDLRRLLDAQNLSVWQANIGNKNVAAAVTVNEGNLPDDLIEQVWQGTRRPKGNLVAQSLVAHAGERLAAKLRSVRINRIAVINTYRRQSIAKQLVQNIVDDAKAHNYDFVSVSFAYSSSNYQFWTACGFTLVHVSSHKQASSGSYSVMVLKSLTEYGQQLIRKLTQRLHRNAYWLKNIIDLPFNKMIKNHSNLLLSLNLDTHDFDELTGFAYYHRPFEASYAALCRLNSHIQTRLQSQSTQASALPVLSALLKSKNNQNLIIDLYQLAGKQALMQTIKHEVRTWLAKQGDNVIFAKIDSKNN
jgi:tRNA(Met) cytidine acetyltransferase